MKLTDKIKLGMTWLTLLALGCAQGSTSDKYKYPSLKDITSREFIDYDKNKYKYPSLLIDNVVYSELIDYDKDGLPDLRVISYSTNKDSVINFIAGYRITDIIRDESSIVGYKIQKYPLAISHHNENGKIYLMQYDEDENGTIDRYEDVNSDKSTEKESYFR